MKVKREQKAKISNIVRSRRPYGTFEENSAWITPLGEYNIVHYDCPTDGEIRQRVEEAIKEILKEATEQTDCPLCEMMKSQAYNIVYYCKNWCHKCEKAKRCKNFNPNSKKEEGELNRDIEKWMGMSKEEMGKELNLWPDNDEG